MVDGLLVVAESVDLVKISFVALHDMSQQRFLLFKTLLWSLEANEGGYPYIPGSNGVMQG